MLIFKKTAAAVAQSKNRRMNSKGINTHLSKQKLSDIFHIVNSFLNSIARKMQVNDLC